MDVFYLGDFMNIKRILIILLSTLLFINLVACNSNNTSKTIDRESVIVAIGSEPETLDPTQGWGHGNSPIIQSTLVKYNANLEFENDLATSYKLSDDGLTWTFNIREDVKFSDGVALTANDVVFTLLTAKKAMGSVDLTYMETAIALNDYTVEIKLSSPTSIFLNTLASIGIVPEHAYDEDYGRNPIGSGPYKLVEWIPQEQMILEVNEYYYGDMPNIKNVTVVFMSEDAALAAIEAGQVDVAYSTATLASTVVSGYHIESIKSFDNRGLTLPVLPNIGETNENGAPIGNNVTCNKEIRQAIAYGINRDEIVDVVLNGYGRAAYSENDGAPWNNSEVAIETDIEYAKKLLADNGWIDSDNDGIVEKDGLKAEFRCVYASGDSLRQAIALAISEQLLNIGIKVNVESMSWDEIMKVMFSEAVVMGWGSANPNETYYLYRSKGALLDDFYNPEGYMSEITDEYLNKAMQALTPEEANSYWQKVQWDGVTGTSMKGECPWVWIVNLDHVTYIRDGLSIGNQPIHGHGHGLALIQNLNEWIWNIDD